MNHDPEENAVNDRDTNQNTNRDTTTNNVHRLHGTDHETVQDAVHENVQEDVQGIVHADAERVTVNDTDDVHSDAEVIEGEVLTDEESAELDRRLETRGALVVRRATAPVRVVKSAAVAVKGHEPTMTAGKTVLRHSWTVVQGVESFAKRAYDASTMGVYRRQIKAAEAVGDREALKEWADRKEMATERRHKRLMDLPRLFIGLVKVFAATLIGIPLAVFVIAVLTKLTGNGSFTGVWLGFFAVIGFVIAAVSLVWGLFVIALPFLLVLACYREGKRRAEPPNWLVTTSDNTYEATVDESTIALALDALRIGNITRYLKEGYKLQFITPARQLGRGTHAVVRLPAGVPAAEIGRRRTDLATGLHRAASEVWPTVGDEAGILDLWVADKGALADGAGPYPLLEEGLVDVFKGVPAGRTLRGDAIYMPITGRNTIVGGAPEQGKSSAARITMMGVALDPTAELRIWVPDMNFDFERFRPRCSRYVRGADDDSMRQIRDDLKELFEEMQSRGDLLDKFEIPEVNRQIADKNVGLHPIVALLEEAHVAYNHAEYGKEISYYATQIVQLGRKRGIHLITSTQAPTATSIPRDITRNCTNGIAFYVADHTANDALLGQGAYKAGIKATDLIPGKDRGTSATKGFTAARFEFIQWYFLSVAKDNDQVTPLIERSLAAIKKRNMPAPTDNARPEIETRDLLADLDEVLNTDPVNIADVPALLRDLAPDWTPYQNLSGKALRETLAADHGIKVPSTGNRYPLDPTTVRNAIVLRERDAGPADDTAPGAEPLAS
ncbi:S-DNA-T family DNA segregation ATPase FtsK/SpoIIIE [Kribbella amoyensis]|uniref:S-DNA-T family DNA segregation ATPase FtsK/SpoIIIE n=1 Tax=Kribbella amoyensis TaxID=996641 RepID=A0A561BNC5_9ACTN|nr:FtsK/SpoIIIE domain-containing protein [Kribbella amoyensis]TWD80391.1 S-DNA-T family DNA segregation ATPase FtsK/SpoIIIE [Kribbella amoyensis]